MWGEKSLETAKQGVSEKLVKLKEVINECNGSPDKLVQFKNEDKYGPYDLGPMMILHAIKVKALDENDKEIIRLVQKAIKIEKLSNEEINTIIEAGLSMDMNAFIKNLIRRHSHVDPFIDPQLLLNLFKLVSSIDNTSIEEDDALPSDEDWTNQSESAYMVKQERVVAKHKRLYKLECDKIIKAILEGNQD